MQIVTSWMEQGEQTATLKSVSRVLTRRVGALEVDVNERLSKLSITHLESLLDVALDFQRVDELISWLDANNA